MTLTATVTVAPKVVSTGVEQKTFTVKKVNPFVNWSATSKTQPDEDDYGLVNEYRIYKTHTYATRSVSLYETLAGTRTSGGFTILNSGIEVFLNSAPAPSAISGVFSLASNTVSYTFSESALSAHKGGLVEIKGYVENMHSMNRIYHAGAELGIYVHGAIGAKMSGIGTNIVEISTAWCGSEASYGFSSLTGANLHAVKLIGTRYDNEDVFSYIPNTVVNNIPADGSVLGSRVYQLQRSGATLDSAAQIMEAESPQFKFLSVGSIGVFVTGDGLTQGYYYLQPSGTPTITDDKGPHGYYVLHLLGDIQNKGGLSGPKQGWLLD